MDVGRWWRGRDGRKWTGSAVAPVRTSIESAETLVLTTVEKTSENRFRSSENTSETEI